MASTTAKPVKQLAELLQEQQEPFVLEVYLFERGYVRKCLNSKSNRESSSRFCHTNSSKTFNRSSSSSSGLNKTEKGTLSCSKVLRSAYNKLVPRKNGPSNKSCGNKQGKFNADSGMCRNGQEIGESDRFSSASSRTQYDSCSEGDKDEAPVSLRNDQDTSLAADTSQVSKLCGIEEREIERFNAVSSKTQCKQHNPVSVLADKTSHADATSPLHNRHELHALSRTEERPCPSICDFILPNKLTEDSILSASLWELLFHPSLEKPRGSGVSEKLEPVRANNLSPQFTKSKRVLQQTRQLLFDCVREMTETHAKKGKEQQQNYKRFLGAEEIGKLIYEKLETWGKQAGDEGNIKCLLELDLLGSAEEWDNCHQEKRCIGLEIGDAILEEIIKEIITET